MLPIPESQFQNIYMASLLSTRVKYNLNVNLKGAAISGNGLCWMITSNSDEMAYNEPGKAARVQITEKAINVISNELEAPPISVSLYRLPVK